MEFYHYFLTKFWNGARNPNEDVCDRQMFMKNFVCCFKNLFYQALKELWPRLEGSYKLEFVHPSLNISILSSVHPSVSAEVNL